MNRSFNAKAPRVLIVSNGHGEDSLGVLFAKALEDQNSCQVDAFPLVGLGQAYERAGIPVVGVQKGMPSGGFMRQGIGPLVQDLRAGLLPLTRAQMTWLKQMGPSYDWGVAMGDIFPLWLCGTKFKRPFVFFPTAKSDYIRPHYGFEVALMRKWPVAVFPRDANTADGLKKLGVHAVYVGNLMMDAVKPSGVPLAGSAPMVALLPGSRSEAYRNTLFLLGAVERLPTDYRFALALASELEPGEIARRAGPLGWKWDEPDRENHVHGLCGHMRKGKSTLDIYKGRFTDILSESTIVLGMAGTANEQAVGVGKPVITCPGQGPQFTEAFVAAQKRLLGDAVLVTESSPDALAKQVMEVLTNKDLYRHMSEEGRRRMGKPGAAERAAAYCLSLQALHETAGNG